MKAGTGKCSLLSKTRLRGSVQRPKKQDVGSVRKERQNTVMWGTRGENGTAQETWEGGGRETQKTDWDSVTQRDKPI